MKQKYVIIKYYFTFIFFSINLQVISQNLDTNQIIQPLVPLSVENEFPDGLYSTFAQFRDKTPDKLDLVAFYQKKKKNSYKFHYKTTGKKVKYVFAIVKDGNVYVRKNHIRYYLSRDGESNGQLTDNDYGRWSFGIAGTGMMTGTKTNKYSKLEKYDEYLYIEDAFTNKGVVTWTGAIGAALDGKPKAIVYIISENRFKLFRNYNFFEEFIKTKHPEKKYLFEEVEENKILGDLTKIRYVMSRIDEK